MNYAIEDFDELVGGVYVPEVGRGTLDPWPEVRHLPLQADELRLDREAEVAG